MPEKFTFSREGSEDGAASILEEEDSSSRLPQTSSAPSSNSRIRNLAAACFDCSGTTTTVDDDGDGDGVMMEPMRINALGDRVVIIGAGAIGGFVGCCLYQDHTTMIQFLVRNAQQIEHYRTTGGLTARSTLEPHFEARIPPEEIATIFTTDASCLKEATSVFVATKRTSNASIHRLLCQHQVQCPVVFLQNGIRIHQDLTMEHPVRFVRKPLPLPSRLYVPIEAIVIMNVVLNKETGTLTVGQPLKDVRLVLNGKPKQLEQQSTSSSNSATISSSPNIDVDEVCHLFDSCVITAYAEKRHDFISLQAAKLQMNMMNAINALSGLSIAETLQDYGYRQVLARSIEECRAVFGAHKVSIQAVGPDMSNVRLQFMSTVLRSWNVVFASVMGSSKLEKLQGKCSMAQDLDNRVAKTEVEYLNGVVVRLGYEAGVPTPINERLLELVQRAESLQMGSPHLSPQELLVQVGMVSSPSSSSLSSPTGRIRPSSSMDPPTLMSNATIQDELIQNMYTSNSSSSSNTMGTDTTFYTADDNNNNNDDDDDDETVYSLRHRVTQMLGLTSKVVQSSSESTMMMPYVKTPPMSPASTTTTTLSPTAAAATRTKQKAMMEMTPREFASSFDDQSVRIWN